MYGSDISDKSSLKRCFNTNRGYMGFRIPTVPAGAEEPKGNVLLNTNARYFWEDIPYGLVILKDIGHILGVPTPNATKLIKWHQKFMPVKYVDVITGDFLPGALKNTGAPSRFGVVTPEDLVATSLSNSVELPGSVFTAPAYTKL